MNSPVFPCARPLQPSCRSLRSGGDTGNLLCFRGVEQWDCAVSSSWIVSCDPVSKFIGILNRLFFLSRKIVQFEKINFFVLVLKRKDLLSFPLKLFIHACVNNFDRFPSKFYHRRERSRASRPWLFTTRFGIFRGFPVHAINLARPETNVSSVDKKSRLARIGL